MQRKTSAAPQRMKMDKTCQYFYYGWERKVDQLMVR
jgi:hypothetical protein